MAPQPKTMRPTKIFLAVLTFTFLMLLQAVAQVLFSDGFESYQMGSLDANLAGGPNQAPNGGPGNPWFGPAPPNMQVVGSVGGVNPHSGNQMVVGHFANDFDQDWLNIASRFNSGSAFMGSLQSSWWFYDPSGAGDTNFGDYVALGYYNSASGTGGLDYPASSGGNLNPGGASQRLSLGASNPTGFNANNYQARVVGATDGLNGGQWFNVGNRTVGWHHADIALGTPNGANTMVSFYLDGVDVLDHAISSANGVNVIEMNGGYGSTLGYYDDFTLTAVPEPGTVGLILSGGLMVLLFRRRK
jgi:hypothetical protein